MLGIRAKAHSGNPTPGAPPAPTIADQITAATAARDEAYRQHSDLTQRDFAIRKELAQLEIDLDAALRRRTSTDTIMVRRREMQDEALLLERRQYILAGEMAEQDRRVGELQERALSEKRAHLREEIAQTQRGVIPHVIAMLCALRHLSRLANELRIAGGGVLENAIPSGMLPTGEDGIMNDSPLVVWLRTAAEKLEEPIPDLSEFKILTAAGDRARIAEDLALLSAMRANIDARWNRYADRVASFKSPLSRE